MTKICSKCKQEKSFEEFYGDKRRKDGLRSQCKICYKAYWRTDAGKAVQRRAHRRYHKSTAGKAVQRRWRKSVAGKEAMRRYHKSEPRRAYLRRWQESEKGKEALRRYRLKNPHKIVAHNVLNHAVRDGKLERGPCEVCGTIFDVHGHHEDYAKPLDVAWLCRKHHVDLGLNKGV